MMHFSLCGIGRGLARQTPTVIALVVLLGMGAAAVAQDADQCAAVLRAAWASMTTECDEQPFMTACYGSQPATVTGAGADVTFDAPGDTVPLAEIDRLSLGGADIPAGQWSLVQMTVRYTFTNEALPLYVMGDVTLENTGSPAADVPSARVRVISERGAVVRAAPGINAARTGVYYTGDRVLATGRNGDGSWIRVYNDDDGTFGWINALVFRQRDLTDLPIVSPEDDALFGSFQSFTLQTTPPDRENCRSIPPSGVLLQTPAEGTVARLAVNGTLISIAPASTVFLSADEALSVDVLEGEAGADTVSIEAGENATVREGEETTPQAYDYDRVALLPLDQLPRPIFAALDFSTLIRPATDDPLAGIAESDPCVIAAVGGAVNVREAPSPGARVRYVMQVGESATPDGRAGGTDNVLWWRLAEDVWVSSNAAGVAGACGTLPVLPPS